MMRDFFLLVVPAVVALTIVAASVYVLVFEPGKELPQFMVLYLVGVLGYFFGLGITRS